MVELVGPLEAQVAVVLEGQLGLQLGAGSATCLGGKMKTTYRNA
jgi:hypothetical protein